MIEIEVTKRGPVPSVMRRTRNDVNRASMRAAGAFWTTHFRKEHFTNRGSTKYGYTPRSGEAGRPFPGGFKKSYTGRKLREKGHTRPLEWSGESKARTENPNIVATATKGEARVVVKMNAPGLNRRYTGSPINMREEMLRVIQPEAERIGGEVGRTQQRQYEGLGALVIRKSDQRPNDQ